MQEYYQTLFSKPRLDNYSNFNDYLDNIVYSQTYYATLHLIEVALRNKMNAMLSTKLGNSWLSDSIIHSTFLYKDTIDILHNQIISIKKQKTNINHDDIVSNLTFGFWVSLFSRKYYKKYSTTEIKTVFNVPRHAIANETKLLQISRELAVIKNFRNRVFHYEKVNNHTSYVNIGNLLNKYLKALDLENILQESISLVNFKFYDKIQSVNGNKQNYLQNR